jgi:hypothetical protein
MIKDLDKLYIGLFLFICLFSCDFNEDKKLGEELKNLTSNFSTSSYFIVIDVKYKDEIFPIVIENYTLYDMMFETRKIDTRDEYISEITKCIMNKDTVIFNSTKDKEILESYKVYENDTLKSLLKANPCCHKIGQPAPEAVSGEDLLQLFYLSHSPKTTSGDVCHQCLSPGQLLYSTCCHA